MIHECRSGLPFTDSISWLLPILSGLCHFNFDIDFDIIWIMSPTNLQHCSDVVLWMLCIITAVIWTILYTVVDTTLKYLWLRSHPLMPTADVSLDVWRLQQYSVFVLTVHEFYLDFSCYFWTLHFMARSDICWWFLGYFPSPTMFRCCFNCTWMLLVITAAIWTNLRCRYDSQIPDAIPDANCWCFLGSLSSPTMLRCCFNCSWMLRLTSAVIWTVLYPVIDTICGCLGLRSHLLKLCCILLYIQQLIALQLTSQTIFCY